MKGLLIVITILISLSSFGNERKNRQSASPSTSEMTELECYKKYYQQIEDIDTRIIKLFQTLFNAEEELLDQYFNPKEYYRGPHVPYKASIKNKLLVDRALANKVITSSIETSQLLSNELKTCIKYSTN